MKEDDLTQVLHTLKMSLALSEVCNENGISTGNLSYQLKNSIEILERKKLGNLLREDI